MRGLAFAVAAAVTMAGAARAIAQEAPAPPPREALGDAWWTGPLLAAAAGTLPKGHVLFEPYFYDSVPYARFDGHGASHGVAHENDLGSQAYLNYGLTDLVTVGVIPRLGYAAAGAGRGGSHLAIGDLSVQAQYRLTQFQEGDPTPTISVNVAETLPTGAYDRLRRPADGFGAGAYKTTLSLYGQTFFWLANGRILRTRLDLSYAVSGPVSVRDLSVYGTTTGFRGRARPGDQAFGDLAFEYSATQRWVAALDLWYEQDAATRVTGGYPAGLGPPAVRDRFGPSRSLFVAPAVEYNWNARTGVIVGARILAAGRNVTATVVPVAAINMVF